LIFRQANAEDHVHLESADLNGSLGIKGQAAGIHGTQRKAQHAAYRDAARQIVDRVLYITGVDTDGYGDERQRPHHRWSGSGARWPQDFSRV
jgi:hypothetical protein